MPASTSNVLTIGHSTHPVDVFIRLLERHGVTALADVRAAPYSRFNPQFNREALALDLDSHGIAYVFLGRELGGRSNDPTCYEDGRINYKRLGRIPSFQAGIDRVRRGATDHRVALMCAEREPLECHRCLLVAPALEARAVSVAHVGSNGGLEPHGNAMNRLLAIHDLQDSTEDERLFPRSLPERITEAIARQTYRFGHRSDRQANESVRRRGRRREPQP